MYSCIGLRDTETGKKQHIGFVTSGIADELKYLLSDETTYRKIVTDTGNPTYEKDDFLKIYEELRKLEDIAISHSEERFGLFATITQKNNQRLTTMFEKGGFGKEAATNFFKETKGPYEIYRIEKG